MEKACFFCYYFIHLQRIKPFFYNFLMLKLNSTAAFCFLLDVGATGFRRRGPKPTLVQPMLVRWSGLSESTRMPTGRRVAGEETCRCVVAARSTLCGQTWAMGPCGGLDSLRRLRADARLTLPAEPAHRSANLEWMLVRNGRLVHITSVLCS